MLVPSKELLDKAKIYKYAVGHFNTSDLEISQAIIAAALESRSPVIVGTSERAIEYGGLENIANIIKAEADKVDVPVVLHLDHGQSLETVKRCLEVGYTSIMIDGGNLNFEENIKLTKEVTRLVRSKGVSVEGALGALEKNLTNPAEVKQFVRETKVDSLAIAIGNTHGLNDKNEKIDFSLLGLIGDVVNIPLVLHGASSLSEKDIKKAISLGICKINIDTDIRLAFSNDLKKFMKNHINNLDPREILGSAKKAVEKVVKEKIKIFGSAHKI